MCCSTNSTWHIYVISVLYTTLLYSIEQLSIYPIIPLSSPPPTHPPSPLTSCTHRMVMMIDSTNNVHVFWYFPEGQQLHSISHRTSSTHIISTMLCSQLWVNGCWSLLLNSCVFGFKEVRMLKELSVVTVWKRAMVKASISFIVMLPHTWKHLSMYVTCVCMCACVRLTCGLIQGG